MEDEVEVAEVLRDLLLERGYVVEVAADGAQALQRVLTFQPDVVLLDLTMPGLPGDVVLGRLHALDPALPVIVVTGNTDAERARATLASGAFDYVAKPFDADILARVLEAAVAYRG